MLCSWILGRQPSETEDGKSPSFLAALLGGTPPICLSSLRILRVDRGCFPMWRKHAERPPFKGRYIIERRQALFQCGEQSEIHAFFASFILEISEVFHGCIDGSSTRRNTHNPLRSHTARDIKKMRIASNTHCFTQVKLFERFRNILCRVAFYRLIM